MKPLDDYINECMDDTEVEASFDQFMEAFCVRCLNPTCKRSRLNDLKWQQRMSRQADAIYNPSFGNPDDPSLRRHAEQDFQTFERTHVRLTQWESFGGQKPEKMQKRKVHRAEAPKQNHDGSKIKDAVSRLAEVKGKDVADPQEGVSVLTEPSRDAPELDADEKAVSVPESQPREEVQSKPQELRDSMSRLTPKKSLTKPTRNVYNTEVPQEGLLLRPREEVMKSTERSQQQKDPWAVKSGKKQKLVVRASDGKVLDANETKRTNPHDDTKSN